MEILLAVIALALFALFDYFGYNWAVKHLLMTLYRVAQFAFGLALIGVLVLLGEWWSILMAVLMWWTFNADFLYYNFCKWFNAFPDEHDAFENEVLADKVTWAWWTPAGLILGRWKDRGKAINGAILIGQCVLGVLAAIAIQIVIW